jgi:hypothetical protein
LCGQQVRRRFLYRKTCNVYRGFIHPNFNSINNLTL